MPPKRRTNNKKKGKGKGGQGKSKGPKGPLQPQTAPAGGSNNNSTRFEGVIPEEWRGNSNNEFLQENFPTVYWRYKQATKRVFDYMLSECPLTETSNGSGVNALIVSADWMQEMQHPCPPSVLKDLRLAIRTRHRVAKSVYGGGDAGHQHLVLNLQYCYSVLKGLPSKKRVILEERGGELKAEAEEEAVEQQDANPYAVLMEGDEDEEDTATADNEEEMFPSSIPRPDPQPEAAKTLDELMKSDDRTDAILFLLSLDELMASVSNQYESLAKCFRSYRSERVPDSAMIESLLEAAVASNMAIQLVQQLENDLIFQHEHFTTPYRLLATLVLPDITRSLTAILREHSNSQQRITEKDISCFLGDCLECYFRAPSDPLNRKDTIVRDFCQQWHVEDESGVAQLEEYFKGLEQITRLEVPIMQEKRMNQHIASLYESMGGLKAHSWIKNMPFIGGSRAIHHTLRLLQGFGPAVSINKQRGGSAIIQPKRGIFGPTPWRPGRAKEMSDLDELFMTDIMTEWVTICRHGILSQTKLPHQEELCPLIVSIQYYLDNPEKPVRWSTLFAFHGLLTAVFETDPIMDTLVTISKDVFNKFFDTVDWSRNIMQMERDSVEGRAWTHNTYLVLFLRNLGLPAFGSRALWNPLCAGTIFSYVTYVGNLEAGCTLIDCHAQLRIVLHLYNALCANGILRRGELVILDLLCDAFKDTKAVWEGNPPQKGEFVQRFWMCFGMSVSESKRMAREAQHDIRNFKSRPDTNKPTPHAGKTMTRKMSYIEPSQLSKSYRRICNRDFRDVVDKYHTPEQRRRNKGSDQYLYFVRSNDTLDAICEEQKMLAFNFPSTGALLEQFVCSLGRILQWEPILASGAAKMQSSGIGLGVGNNKRQGFVHFFAQHLLGALDFADDPFSYQFLQVPLGEASSSFMKTFFSRLDIEKVRWFQAIQEED